MVLRIGPVAEQGVVPPKPAVAINDMFAGTPPAAACRRSSTDDEAKTEELPHL